MAKKKAVGKLIGGVAKLAGKVAGFTPAGRVAKTALGIAKGAGKVLGLGGAKRAVSRRGRGITQKYLNRAMTRLVKARIEGKIMKEKFKVINIIR